MLRNDVNSIGGTGGFGTGDGMLGLIALLAIMRGNLFGGDTVAASSNLSEIQGQLANIRSDIGDVKYDTVNSILAQTNALMAGISDGKFENMAAILSQTNQLQSEFNQLQSSICATQASIAETKYDLGSQISQSSCETNLNITKMGYENQLATQAIENSLSRQIAECCCATNLRLTELDYQGQLRDQANFAALLNGQTEIKCLIKDTAKDEEIARLTRESDRSFISNEINKSINTTVGSWAAARAFNGPTYPNPPYNGAWGF